jgi:hypothetical protein
MRLRPLWQTPIEWLGRDPAGGTVKSKLGGTLFVAACVLLAFLAYHLTRSWQTQQPRYDRVALPGACDLRLGPCGQRVGGRRLSFSISPTSIPLMQPLKLLVEVDGPAVQGVSVEIRGLNMDMGLNRNRLVQAGRGRWEGETILPVCSQRTMRWEAAVRVDGGDGRFEVPFLFHTRRP